MPTSKLRQLADEINRNGGQPATSNRPLRGALKQPAAREYLGGLSVPTMSRLVKRGLLKPNRSTRHLLFPISELDRFLKAGQY